MNELEAGDWLAELLAVGGVGDGITIDSHTDAVCDEHDIETAWHKDTLDSFPIGSGLGEEGCWLELDIFEVDLAVLYLSHAQFVLDFVTSYTWSFHIDDESWN